MRSISLHFQNSNLSTICMLFRRILSDGPAFYSFNYTFCPVLISLYSVAPFIVIPHRVLWKLAGASGPFVMEHLLNVKCGRKLCLSRKLTTLRHSNVFCSSTHYSSCFDIFSSSNNLLLCFYSIPLLMTS